MSVFEPGRVCIKIAGREAGKYCVVLEVIDENFVLVQGPEVKKRRCNIAHLQALPEKVEIKEGVDINKTILEKFGKGVIK